MRTLFGMLALSTLVSTLPAQGGGACSAYGPSCGPKLRGHSFPEGPLRQLRIGFTGGFGNAAGLHVIGVKEARFSIPTSPFSC
ncbi:MAG: hypothetical protein ACE5F1_04230 [Planctomycetota bacterium]